MTDEKKINASNFKCSEKGCKAQAEAFYPIFDIDIPAHPYCKKHAEKRLHDLMKAIQEIHDKRGD